VTKCVSRRKAPGLRDHKTDTTTIHPWRLAATVILVLIHQKSKQRREVSKLESGAGFAPEEEELEGGREKTGFQELECCEVSCAQVGAGGRAPTVHCFPNHSLFSSRLWCGVWDSGWGEAEFLPCFVNLVWQVPAPESVDLPSCACCCYVESGPVRVAACPPLF
jgi:hypothetical protein